MWRKWLALRTICTHNKYNYSYEEACYHYSKNRKVLESEVTKYKEGSYHPNYDWLEEYNRDPEHYRLHDFSRVCKETVNCSSSFISFSFMRYISVT